ncbi:MAG: hypothetical protein HY664_04025 [Chloroflexi bacterium]|nr:hypothetical protein [Chloroflexota bacterium]
MRNKVIIVIGVVAAVALAITLFGGAALAKGPQEPPKPTDETIQGGCNMGDMGTMMEDVGAQCQSGAMGDMMKEMGEACLNGGSDSNGNIMGGPGGMMGGGMMGGGMMGGWR